MPYQVPITVDSIAEDIVKFYLVVKVTVDPSHVTNILNFAFLDAMGGTLAYHLVSWDSGTGAADFLVKAKLLAVGTTLYLQYS